MSLFVQFAEARPIREVGRAETRAATAMGVKMQNLIATGLIKQDACNRSEYDEMTKGNRRTAKREQRSSPAQQMGKELRLTRILGYILRCQALSTSRGWRYFGGTYSTYGWLFPCRLDARLMHLCESLRMLRLARWSPCPLAANCCQGGCARSTDVVSGHVPTPTKDRTQVSTKWLS